jgi:hypothetical protein
MREHLDAQACRLAQTPFCGAFLFRRDAFECAAYSGWSMLAILTPKT